MCKKEKIRLQLGLFAIGGAGYSLIELLWRGRTHPSMFPVGGLCFLLIGGIHKRYQRKPLLSRCALCSLAVTMVELVSGCILNRWLKLNVWDYSHKRCNLWGQVCLLYTFFWLILSAFALPVYRISRRLLLRRRTNLA